MESMPRTQVSHCQWKTSLLQAPCMVLSSIHLGIMLNHTQYAPAPSLQEHCFKFESCLMITAIRDQECCIIRALCICRL